MFFQENEARGDDDVIARIADTGHEPPDYVLLLEVLASLETSFDPKG